MLKARISPQIVHARFSGTKLLVDDLDSTAEFYKSVCDLVEGDPERSTINEHSCNQLTLVPADSNGSPLTLVKFTSSLRPMRGEVILGFTTFDLEAFIARVLNAGGRLVDPARNIRGRRRKIAFVEDTEGHLIEVTQPL